jgi:hypothetical protein
VIAPKAEQSPNHTSPVIVVDVKSLLLGNRATDSAGSSLANQQSVVLIVRDPEISPAVRGGVALTKAHDANVVNAGELRRWQELVAQAAPAPTARTFA